MPQQRIFADATLRETRARAGLTQHTFAKRLGVSPPYLSQMQNDHRPASAGVLMRLAAGFGVDVGALAAGDAARTAIDMAEAFADPLPGQPPPMADLRLAAANAPSLARACRAFLSAAQTERHDLDRLARRFSAPPEQMAHRLSTLQRPGAQGVAFFFARVDRSGTATKRASATRLQFARFGGACGPWNVRRAFETPGRFLRQLAETREGVRFLCLARDVTKPGAGNAPERRFAIGPGHEISAAARIAHADGLDLGSPASFAPIGVSCRICPRPSCRQRAVPPIDRAIRVARDRLGLLPHEVV